MPRRCVLACVPANSRTLLPDQILFGLFLPGAELVLAMSLHGIDERGERQMPVST